MTPNDILKGTFKPRPDEIVDAVTDLIRQATEAGMSKSPPRDCLNASIDLAFALTSVKKPAEDIRTIAQYSIAMGRKMATDKALVPSIEPIAMPVLRLTAHAAD